MLLSLSVSSHISILLSVPVSMQGRITSVSPKHASLFSIVAILSLSSSVVIRHGGTAVRIFSGGSLGPTSVPQFTRPPATFFILDDINIHLSRDCVKFFCSSLRLGSPCICPPIPISAARWRVLAVRLSVTGWLYTFCGVCV